MKRLLVTMAVSMFILAGMSCGARDGVVSKAAGSDVTRSNGLRFVPATVTSVETTCVGNPVVACHALVSYQVACNQEYFRTQYLEDGKVDSLGHTVVDTVVVAVILKQLDVPCDPSVGIVSRTFETRAYDPGTHFYGLESRR